MGATTFLYLVLSCQPCHTPNVIYTQLPTQDICAHNYKYYESKRTLINNQLSIATGWNRQSLLQQSCEIEKLIAIWYAAWWLTWENSTKANQIEWSQTLINYIGMKNFCQGNLPSP